MIQPSTETGEVVENYLLTQGDEVTEHDVTRIIDRMSRHIKQSSKASLAGTRVVKKWHYRHPDTGAEIVGRIRLWTYDDLVASQQIRDFTSRDTRGGHSNAVNPSAESAPELVDPEEVF